MVVMVMRQGVLSFAGQSPPLSIKGWCLDLQRALCGVGLLCGVPSVATAIDMSHMVAKEATISLEHKELQALTRKNSCYTASPLSKSEGTAFFI